MYPHHCRLWHTRNGCAHTHGITALSKYVIQGTPKKVQVMSSFALRVAGVAVLTNSPLKLALNRESTRVDFPQPVSPASEQRLREREREEGEEGAVHSKKER